jgi:hypothetical protein
VRTRILNIILLKRIQFLFTDAITLRMNPLIALITPNKPIRACFIIGLHANWAIIALLIASVTFLAKSAFVVGRRHAPLIPLALAERSDWELFLFATHALDAVVTEPTLGRNFGESRL